MVAPGADVASCCALRFVGHGGMGKAVESVQAWVTTNRVKMDGYSLKTCHTTGSFPLAMERPCFSMHTHTLSAGAKEQVQSQAHHLKGAGGLKHTCQG